MQTRSGQENALQSSESPKKQAEREKIMALIGQSDPGLLIETKANLEHFSDSEIVLLLYEANASGNLAIAWHKIIENFKNLNEEVFWKLLDDLGSRVIVKILDRFSGLSLDAFRTLLNDGRLEILDHKETFNELPDDIDRLEAVYKVKKELSIAVQRGEREAVTLNELGGILKNFSDFTAEDLQDPNKFDGFRAKLYLQQDTFQYAPRREDIEKLASYLKMNTLEIITYLLQQYDLSFGLRIKSELEFIATYIESKSIKDPSEIKSLIQFTIDYLNLRSEAHDPTTEFCNIFGYERLKILWREPSTEIHIIVPSILKCFKASGATAGVFWSDFINQNSMDGTANLYDMYNMIEGVTFDMSDLMTRAAQTGEQSVIAKAEEFASDSPFISWTRFKQYYDFNTMLANEKIGIELIRLQDAGMEDPLILKRYEFFSTLAFHRESKVSAAAVFELMLEPARFLEVGDDHAFESTDRKKPSNFTYFQHLDLSAEDLRDSLTDGVLDALQFFPPATQEITITEGETSDDQFLEYVIDSIGSRTTGDANPKLFGAVNKILKSYGISFDAFKTGNHTSQVRADIEALYGNFNFNKPGQEVTYQISVYPKSSPVGHLAGNDTACCMPFGSGKNNVYTFNPTCAQLVVREKRSNGWKTIAQSVLTPDININHEIPSLLGVVDRGQQLHEVIKTPLTERGEIYITADNIEVAPNAKNQAAWIENAYRSFMTDYREVVAQHNPAIELNTDYVVVGTGYSDAFDHLPTIKNTYAPMCPPSYSDQIGYASYRLDYGKEGVVKASKIESSAPNHKFNVEPTGSGIRPLDPKDTLAVSYLEGKVYADNESLVQYIHRIGNELVAASVNNELKNRPNLMSKMIDENGAMLGYLLAYEGVLDKEAESKQRAIYISDLAADIQKSKLAGGRLIQDFVDKYGTEYLAQNDPLPIVFEARDTTSYQIVQKHIEKLGIEHGYTFEAKETGTYNTGKDLMHVMQLTPVKVENG